MITNTIILFITGSIIILYITILLFVKYDIEKIKIELIELIEEKFKDKDEIDKLVNNKSICNFSEFEIGLLNQSPYPDKYKIEKDLIEWSNWLTIRRKENDIKPESLEKGINDEQKGACEVENPSL